MRLERFVCRVCDAMVVVLVCLGFLLSSSTGHAHAIPEASQSRFVQELGFSAWGRH